MDGNGTPETVACTWVRGHWRAGTRETVLLIDCGPTPNDGHLWRAARYRQGRTPDITPPGNRTAADLAIAGWADVDNAWWGRRPHRPVYWHPDHADVAA
jgi:hypothetical protein